ncbi:MAG: hypothetical protein HY879_18910 [Deltaproteobacteria bacterium]|nr:hypothetical protein [Deltaproteobacteria bacterium]
MKNSRFNTQEVKICCQKKLHITFREGGELNGWFKLENKKIARITVPKGRKPISPKTYKSMAMHLKLTVERFDSLLECTLNQQDYEEILKNIIV